MNHFPLLLRYVPRGVVIIASFIITGASIAKNDTELIDCFWSLSTNPLPETVTIGNEKFYGDKKRTLGEITLSHLTQPALKVQPMLRFYGTKPREYFVRAQTGFRRSDPAQLTSGRLLYASSTRSTYRLAAYVRADGNIELINNQKVNASIIGEVLTAPSIRVSELPPETLTHIFSFSSLKDIYNVLLSNQHLSAVAKKSLKNRLRELQKEGPLEVTPTLLDKLARYKKYIRRIELTNGIPSYLIRYYQKEDINNTINNQALEKLDKFTHLEELRLRLAEDAKITDLDLSHLPKSLSVLSLEGKVSSLNNAFLDAIKTQCPQIREIRLVLDDVTPPMLAGLLPYERHIAGINLKEEGGRGIDDSALQELGKFTHLEELLLNLDYRYDHITPIGLKYLPRNLKSLTFYDLPAQINDAYLEIIAKQLLHLMKIVVEADPSYTLGPDLPFKISDRGLEALVNGCPDLISISLSESCITDEGVRYIAEHYSQLQSLNIGCCKGVTTEGIKSLIKLNKLRYLICGYPYLYLRGFTAREAVKAYLEELNR